MPASTVSVVKVKDPDGQTWRVTRRWVPWRRRLRGVVDGIPSPPSGLGDDPISATIAAIFLIIAIPFLLVGLIALVELLLVLLLLPVALVGRVCFGRHWVVEARKGFSVEWDERSGGWRTSGLRIRGVAESLQRGEGPPPQRDVNAS